jgi:hypothetical protein
VLEIARGENHRHPAGANVVLDLITAGQRMVAPAVLNQLRR